MEVQYKNIFVDIKGVKWSDSLFSPSQWECLNSAMIAVSNQSKISAVYFGNMPWVHFLYDFSLVDIDIPYVDSLDYFMIQKELWEN